MKLFSKENDLYLKNAHIAEYRFGNINNHEPLRSRRLLLHKKELLRLKIQKERSGFSIIPLKMYFKKHLVKIELGLGKGKKNYDKRETIKKADADRHMARFMRRRR